MPKDKKIIEPIDADFDDVAKAMVPGDSNVPEEGPGKGKAMDPHADGGADVSLSDNR